MSMPAPPAPYAAPQPFSALGGCTPAAPGRRAGAAVLDGLLSAVPAGLAGGALQAGLLTGSVPLVVLGSVLVLGWLVGYVLVAVRFARTGVSPGKKAMGLRLVDVRTGGVPGIGAAWPRAILAGLGGAVVVGFVLAVVQILQNRAGDRRTWYDSTTNVVLLDVVAGRDPVASAASAGPAAPVSAPPPPAPAMAPVPTLVTMDGAPLHPPVPPPPVAPDEAPEDDDDIESTMVTIAVSKDPDGAGTPGIVVATLTFDSGTTQEVSGRGVVGRKPHLPDGAEGGTAVVVEDETRTVSKTHLEFEVQAAGLLVTDLWTTNGSAVTDPHGARAALEAGRPTLAAYGSTVTVGDHWFTVERILSPQEEYEDAGETILRGPL